MIIMNRGVLYCIGLCLVIVVLFASNLLLGSVSIPAEDVMRILLGDTNEKASWRFIILESRLPQAITAMFCGASLAVSGLMLQTIFRNPLAGPSVFGINSGAGLGVALVMLFLGGGLSVGWGTLCWFPAVQRLCGCVDSCFLWSFGGDGCYLLLLHIGTQSCHAADYRHHDWLHLQFCHLAA